MSLAGVFADDDEARAAFLADVAATLVAALLGPTKRDIRVAACGWRVGRYRGGDAAPVFCECCDVVVMVWFRSF